MDSTKFDRSMRRLVFSGVLAVTIIMGGVGAWASLSQINGAVIAAGRLVVEGDLKRVQHREGGTVNEILVRNGDKVNAGDPLVHLDTLELGTELSLTTQQRLEWMARLARLHAERDENKDIDFPGELLEASGELGRELIEAQSRQFHAQRAATESRIGQLEKRIEQSGQEIIGLNAERMANRKQFEIATQELEDSQALLDKGLTQRQNVLSVRREVARLEGSDGQLMAQIARAEGRISETQLQIIQLNDDVRTRTLEELREAESKYLELTDRRLALQEKLSRATIAAPWSGIVHEMEIFNSGAVISPGQAIMAIVPDNDELLVEAEVRPQDIDQVSLDQPVDLVFENANTRITPRIKGRIKWISAYLRTSSKEEAPSFYTIRIAAENNEMSLLNELELRPGMPVSAFIQTAPRTPVSFLLKPASEMWERVFREK